MRKRRLEEEPVKEVKEVETKKKVESLEVKCVEEERAGRLARARLARFRAPEEEERCKEKDGSDDGKDSGKPDKTSSVKSCKLKTCSVKSSGTKPRRSSQAQAKPDLLAFVATMKLKTVAGAAETQEKIQAAATATLETQEQEATSRAAEVKDVEAKEATGVPEQRVLVEEDLDLDFDVEL